MGMRRILVIALVAAVGCGANGIQHGGTGGSGGTDGGGSGGTGGGGSGGGGGDHGTSTDMAMPMHDLAGVTPGTAAFGATCTVDGDCQSLMCRQFVMGTVHRCTKACTVATQATDCPAPSAGVCTNNGYCKFNQ